MTEIDPANGAHSRRAVLNAAGAFAASSLMTIAASSAVAATPATTVSGGPVPTLRFVYDALVTLDPTVEVGPTPYGARRRIPIIGGTFEGPDIKGVVLSGGADWQLVRADGATVIEADYMMRTDDGVDIHVYNKGIGFTPKTAGAERYLRAAPIFEVPIGRHDWLNKAIFVSTLTPAMVGTARAVRIGVFRVD